MKSILLITGGVTVFLESGIQGIRETLVREDFGFRDPKLLVSGRVKGGWRNGHQRKRGNVWVRRDVSVIHKSNKFEGKE